ncbi:hypothetical protein NIES4073_02650 (plasmid) [Kalymmatonema gypsitolerans NIES-4073]|nr:hypothetical protein NIES4073_02650 [Scytonema sp. NIES-4073]
MITIKINSTELGKFKGSASALKNMQKPMKQALAYLELETKTQFVTQSDFDGNRWKDLAPSTWARKKSGVIGRETSVMVNSIYTRLNGGLEGEIGLSAEYTIFFHAGTEKMPARPILGINDKRLTKIQSVFEIYIGDLFN